MASDPKYLLSATKREVERLQKQHAWVQVCLNHKIIFTPVKLSRPDVLILDVGCADGTLLRDLQKQLPPSAHLVGVNIMSSFMPPGPQGNIRYAVHDINEPPAAELVDAFDVTHRTWWRLAPKGWLQVQEMDSGDPASKQFGKAYNDMLSIMASLFDKQGVEARFAARLDEAFKKAGLVNVRAERIELPLGKKLSAKEVDIRNSCEPFKITIPSLFRAAKQLDFDIPESTLDNLAERFEKEALGVYYSYVVIGQNPSE